MKRNYFLAIGLLFLGLSTQAQTEYVDGTLVLNEGNMGTSQGSVSFIDASGTVTSTIFQTANSVEELGDVAQGMATDGESTLIMLNNSNKVEVVDAKTFVSIATIDEGVILPRYAVIHDGLAYVTCWGNEETGAYLAVIDMETFEVDHTVALSSGVEQIYAHEGKLYVLHMGGFSTNSIMSVYDIAAETVEEVIVGDSPSEMVFHDNYAYIISQGQSWATPPLEPTFDRVNLTTHEVEGLTDLDDSNSYKFIAKYEDTFYVKVSADIYTFDTTTQTLSDEAVISSDITTWGGAYGMSIIGDKIYLADAKDYVSAGDVLVYSLDGVLENTYQVGIIPNNIYASASSTVSSDIFGKETIKLYPNPASNRVFLTVDNNTAVQVYDMMGKQLINTTYYSQGIDVSQLSAGTYLMNVGNNGQSQTIRFVKK